MSRLSILRTLCAHWRTSILMRTVAVAATATVALTLVTAAVVFQGAEKDALVEQDARLSDIAVAMARGELGTVLPRARSRCRRPSSRPDLNPTSPCPARAACTAT